MFKLLCYYYCCCWFYFIMYSLSGVCSLGLMWISMIWMMIMKILGSPSKVLSIVSIETNAFHFKMFRGKLLCCFYTLLSSSSADHWHALPLHWRPPSHTRDWCWYHPFNSRRWVTRWGYSSKSQNWLAVARINLDEELNFVLGSHSFSSFWVTSLGLYWSVHYCSTPFWYV